MASPTAMSSTALSDPSAIKIRVPAAKQDWSAGGASVTSVKGRLSSLIIVP